MKRNILVVALATVLATLVTATAAFASGGQGRTLYRFVGQLQSAPAGSSLSVSVEQGNRPALRAMLGQSQVQTFSTNEDTVFLKWSQGIPTVVGVGELAAGDYVTVNIRSGRGSSMTELTATPARLVGDRGPTLHRPGKPLYLFRGTLVGAGDGKVTVDVRGGNRRALKLMIDQPAQQSFSTGSETIFLHWQGRIPTLIDAATLKTGTRVVVRIRADRGATLAEVEAIPARRIAEREPATHEEAESAKS